MGLLLVKLPDTDLVRYAVLHQLLQSHMVLHILLILLYDQLLLLLLHGLKLGLLHLLGLDVELLKLGVIRLQIWGLLLTLHMDSKGRF